MKMYEHRMVCVLDDNNVINVFNGHMTWAGAWYAEFLGNRYSSNYVTHRILAQPSATSAPVRQLQLLTLAPTKKDTMIKLSKKEKELKNQPSLDCYYSTKRLDTLSGSYSMFTLHARQACSLLQHTHNYAVHKYVYSHFESGTAGCFTGEGELLLFWVDNWSICRYTTTDLSKAAPVICTSVSWQNTKTRHAIQNDPDLDSVNVQQFEKYS